MSDVMGPKRAGIWPETLRLLRLNKQEWIKWAVLFFVILIPLDIWISQGSEETIRNLLEALNGNKAALQHPPKSPPGHFISTLGVMLLGFIQFYIYSVIFLKQESSLGFPKVSFGGLFYYTGQVLLWWLIVMGFAILLVIVLVIAMIALAIAVKDNPTLLMVVMFAAALPVMCYLMLRYTLVFPLAACRVKSSIKTGARLMRGNMWRVFLNILPVWLIMGMFTPLNMWLLSKIAVLFNLGTAENAGGLPLAILSVLFLTGLQTVMSVISAAFNCAACTIIVNEKQAVDPAFKLVTSA